MLLKRNSEAFCVVDMAPKAINGPATADRHISRAVSVAADFGQLRAKAGKK
jgi:hypothetical protein